MAENLAFAVNGGARYDARSEMLIACPFCGGEFGEATFDLMIEAEERIYCPHCGTPIYRDQFYMPSMR